MKAFLAQIDWIRNTFFLFFYLFLVLICYIAFILPSLDEFKNHNAEYRRELHTLKQTEIQKNAALEKLENYQKANETILRSFKLNLVRQEIQQKLSFVFDQISVVEDGGPYRDGEYLVQRYVVSGLVKDIVALKNALQMITSFGSVVHFAFPIHIESQNNALIFSFRMDNYLLAQ